MSVSIRLGDEIYEAAKRAAKAECRSIPQQIEFWARVGKAALDNPDLPIEFIRELLIARAEGRTEATPFAPGQHRD